MKMKQKLEFSAGKSLLNIKRQGGWTFWSLAFTLSVMAFFGYVGMQLVPVYTVNGNIKNAMLRSVDGVNLAKVSRSEIITKMSRQLMMDSSQQALNYKDDLVIKRTRSSFTLQISYERRIPIVANISIIAEFNPMVECTFSNQCTLN